MGNFELWFWRPIAEFLGVLAFAVILFGCLFAVYFLRVYVIEPIRRWRKRK